ncbi:hypothetical protein ZWY2020_035729, partial [Hordeum vulgare]
QEEEGGLVEAGQGWRSRARARKAELGPVRPWRRALQEALARLLLLGTPSACWMWRWRGRGVHLEKKHGRPMHTEAHSSYSIVPEALCCCSFGSIMLFYQDHGAPLFYLVVCCEYFSFRKNKLYAKSIASHQLNLMKDKHNIILILVHSNLYSSSGLAHDINSFLKCLSFFSGQTTDWLCYCLLNPVLALLVVGAHFLFDVRLYGRRATDQPVKPHVRGVLTYNVLPSLFHQIVVVADSWADHPRAETALSNILPCVDASTTNRTLYQSKQVMVQLVRFVNRAISALSNRKQRHLHRELMPYLCSPYDDNLNDRQFLSKEVTFDNAMIASAWQDYTSNAPDADVCSGPSIVTPEIYSQLITAANASYALHHYAPPMLNFQDCKFVRDTFSSITLQYCPPLERDLSLVSAGLALLASSLVPGLLLMLFADRPRRRKEVSEQPSRFRVTPVDCSP